MLAIIAPGQGSQTPGMLSAWLEDAQIRTLAQEISDAIGLDVVRLGTTADADEIKDTANAQPLIVAAGLMSAHALGATGSFSYVAGHSVGEITAAAIAGALTPIDAMKLVRARGVEMAKAAGVTPSGMAAVLGGDRQVVLSAIADLGLIAANDNGGGQIVAAGDLDAIAQLAPEGARVRPLAVAGAFHTSYMQPAVEPLRTLAATMTTSAPSVGVLSNKDGAVLTEGAEVLERIVNQIANPVRWDLCMETLVSLGVTGVIEVAPAGTLVGLIKRAAPTIEQFAFKSLEDLDAARAFVANHGGK
ncbi:[acyl-carrier-protein] S-malonyltransferase [Candidatus Planktophila sulfonica]|uniref:Malonyl CoA-acyl carrier protein transacylase n=1 Tax=Candidatus Planktophila sulfonica TaxID=1884904 RepID=A0A249KFU3_9ACTN|nr:ACP S-malonyltransferase [Candidatus Planktophila sulfonica]ASY15673.1 [acyl-carrier-protein] S-malonyltransferase [Candidatus Planktophila sulfonica]